MKFEPLNNSATKEIWQAFNDAFSNYEVPIQMPYEKFQKMGNRRGLNLDISLGAYEGKKLVGFVGNAEGNWNGKKTIYDCFTGIINDYKGKGLGKALLENSIIRSKELGFEQYLLEVITTNEKAYKLYASKGFKIVREFDVYSSKCENIRFSSDNLMDNDIKIIQTPDWNQFKGMWDILPSWQNSIDSVKRAKDTFEIVAAYLQSDCLGYLILDTETGDIPQLAIEKDYRRKGIASALLKKAAENRKQDFKLSLLNIDSDYKLFIYFMKKHEIPIITKQYEMLCEL